MTTEDGASPHPDAAAGPLPLEADRIHRAELQTLFRNNWIPVGRTEELPNPGDYFTWQRTGIPVLIVRSADGQLRGFYNSCRHRGAPVVRTPTGRGRAFRCQYHSWTYDTFGTLVGLPDERDFGDFDRCAYSLVGLALAELGGWLWIDQSGAAPALAASLGPLADELRGDLTRRLAGRVTARVDVNWKTAIGHVAASAEALGRGERWEWSQPNCLFARANARTVMLAAWPIDQQRTELELVGLTSGGDAPDLGVMLSRFADLADGSARAGSLTGQATGIADRLASLWRDAVPPRLADADHA